MRTASIMLALGFLLAACGDAGSASKSDSNLTEAPTATAAQPLLRRCTLKDLFDSGIFEESLSVDEYPDVRVEREANGAIHLSIGVSGFDSDDDDGTLTLTEKDNGDLDVSFASNASSAVYGLTITGTKGEVTYRDETHELGQLTHVADLTCER